MKTVIASLLAAALLVPMAAQAQPVQRGYDQAGERARYTQQDRGDREDRRREASRSQRQVHRFASGDRFERGRAINYRRLDYRQIRRLGAPGRDQVWVRSGDDALLVSVNNNRVQRVVQNVF